MEYAYVALTFCDVFGLKMYQQRDFGFKIDIKFSLDIFSWIVC